ncbi:MAG TPA: hypothetical protein PKJ41_07930 [Bryobacteraceae bacterium]|nr:hypothetical protein [Bryobacteraceae bacterium]
MPLHDVVEIKRYLPPDGRQLLPATGNNYQRQTLNSHEPARTAEKRRVGHLPCRFDSSRTIAGISGQEQIPAKHVAETVQYRGLDPE